MRDGDHGAGISVQNAIGYDPGGMLVKGGGYLVQQQHLGPQLQSAHQRHPLFLAAGKLFRALRQDVLRQVERGEQLFHVAVALRDGMVFSARVAQGLVQGIRHAALIQPGFLHHQADFGAQGFRFVGADIFVPQGDGAVVALVHQVQGMQQRAFSAAGGAHDQHAVAAAHAQAQVSQQHLVRVVQAADGDRHQSIQAVLPPVWVFLPAHR